MTATMPPQVDLRDCHLYRFWVRHPLTGERVLGYIGETVRQPLTRLIEHLYDQPWADTILAWEVDDVVYPGKAAVLEAERRAVEAELPLYNHEWNLANPHRIEIWRAKEQRWNRDTAAARPRWSPPVKQPRQAGTTRVLPVRRTGTPQWSTPVRIKVVLWSCAWGLLTSVVWGYLARYGHWTTGADAAASAVAALGLLLWGILRTPDSVRLWRKRHRAIRRWLR